jgi:hypothetical protein
MYFSASITIESEGMAGVGFAPGTAAEVRPPDLARSRGAAGASVFESGRAALESVEAVSLDSGAFDSASGDFAAAELDGADGEFDEEFPAAGGAAVAPAEPVGAGLLGAGLVELGLFEPAFAGAELSEPGVLPAH